MDFCDLFRRRVTLTFDLLTPKIDRFMPLPCPVDRLYQFTSKSVHSYSKYRLHKFGNRRTDGQKNERTRDNPRT